MWSFRCRQSEVDWRKYLHLPPETRKMHLIKTCNRYDVSIYKDDPEETSSGVYALLRPVASEAELERRLLAKLADRKSAWANLIAAISLLIALVSLAVSILGYSHTP